MNNYWGDAENQTLDTWFTAKGVITTLASTLKGYIIKYNKVIGITK
jgi:hypothetical protein